MGRGGVADGHYQPPTPQVELLPREDRVARCVPGRPRARPDAPPAPPGPGGARPRRCPPSPPRRPEALTGNAVPVPNGASILRH